MKADLFVGVIKWNDEFLLEHCLRSAAARNRLFPWLGMHYSSTPPSFSQLVGDMQQKPYGDYCVAGSGRHRLWTINKALRHWHVRTSPGAPQPGPRETFQFIRDHTRPFSLTSEISRPPNPSPS
jgi:hypothetical protein